MPGSSQPVDGQVSVTPDTNVTVQESNVGAIATAHTEPLVVPQAPEPPRRPVPNLADILDLHQHGPLPRDPNHYFQSAECLQAFTAYLKGHNIMPSGGQGSAGSQHVYLWNILEEQWRRIQEELKKGSGGHAYTIDLLLRQIRERVREHDINHAQWEESVRDHDAHAKRLEQMVEPSDTPGIFKGGAGSVLRPSLFRRPPPRVATGKWPTGKHIPAELRGKPMPGAHPSETKAWRNLSARIQRNYLTRADDPLYSSELLGKPMDFSDRSEWFSRSKPKRSKAGWIASDVRNLQGHIEGRLQKAHALHGLGAALKTYLAGREAEQKTWLSKLKPEDRANYEKAQQHVKATERTAQHNDAKEALKMLGRKMRPRPPMLITPNVSAKIKAALKDFRIDDPGKSERHYVINRLLQTKGIAAQADPDDLDHFIRSTEALKEHADNQAAEVLPSHPQHRYFRGSHPAVTLARHRFDPGKAAEIDPGLKRQAEETVKHLRAHGDLDKWRSLRDYLQMYEKLIVPGTKAHTYMVPNMPWTQEQRTVVMKHPEDMQEHLEFWSKKGKIHGKTDRYMVYPRWSDSRKAFVLAPSKIPIGTNAYPRPSQYEGGIFSDFLSRGDLERVVRDLNITVPDPPHDAMYDEMKLTDARNLVYKPFIEKLTRTVHKKDVRVGKASNFYKDWTTKDVRMYEAVLRKLQAYRALGIDHTRLNEVADFYDTRSIKFKAQLAQARKRSAEIQREMKAPRFPEERRKADEGRLQQELLELKQQFSAQVKARGTAAVYHRPAQKKVPGQQLRDRIIQEQANGFGRTDWRSLLRMDHKRYHQLYDGNQAHALKVELDKIRGTIASLGFHFKKTGKDGVPHAAHINRIGHLENVRRLIGVDSLQRDEERHYGALLQSFRNPGTLHIPNDERLSEKLLELCAEHVAVHQTLRNGGRAEGFLPGYDQSAKWADVANGGSDYFATRPPKKRVTFASSVADVRPIYGRRKRRPDPVPGTQMQVTMGDTGYNIGSFETVDEYKRMYHGMRKQYNMLKASYVPAIVGRELKKWVDRYRGTWKKPEARDPDPTRRRRGPTGSTIRLGRKGLRS